MVDCSVQSTEIMNTMRISALASVRLTYSGFETASHAGYCPINLVNVW